MTTAYDRVKVNTSTTGTGTITLGTAAEGFRTFADAGVVDGSSVSYVIEEGFEWEIGTGTYTASGSTLTRSVQSSSNSDAAIELGGNARVYITLLSNQIVEGADSATDGNAVLFDGTSGKKLKDAGFAPAASNHTHADKADLESPEFTGTILINGETLVSLSANSLSSLVEGLTEKASPAYGDMIPLVDAEDDNDLKWVDVENLTKEVHVSSAGGIGEPLAVTIQDGVQAGSWPIALNYPNESTFTNLYAEVLIGTGTATCWISHNDVPVYGPFTANNSAAVNVDDLDLSLEEGDTVDLVIESVDGTIDYLYVQLSGNMLGTAPYYIAWTATEGQTEFEGMPIEPASNSALTVLVGHLQQPKNTGAYTYSGTTLTLSEGVDEGTLVEASIIHSAPIFTVLDDSVGASKINGGDAAAIRTKIGLEDFANTEQAANATFLTSGTVNNSRLPTTIDQSILIANTYIRASNYRTTNTFSYAISGMSEGVITPAFMGSWSDVSEFMPILSAEYHDGSDWVDWADKISDLEILLDGRPDTRITIPLANAHFRFVAELPTYHNGALWQFYQEWVSTGPRTYTYTIERCANADFASGVTTVATGSAPALTYYQNVVGVSHANEKYYRFTLDIDSGAVDTSWVWIRALTSRANYGQFLGLPFSWNYDKDLLTTNVKVGGRDVMVYRGIIPDAADLNDYVTDGYWSQNQNAYAAAGTNYPTPMAGILTVKRDAGAETFVYQTYHTYAVDKKFFMRELYDSTWSSWREVLTTESVLTDIRINPRIGTTASSSTPTPNSDNHDQYNITALAANATFGEPSGTPTDGQKLTIRIKDDGTARTLSWNSIYRAIGITLPTTTVISKTMYIGCVYNAADTKWDVVAVSKEN